MSGLSLSKPINSIIPARAEIELEIRNILANLRSAGKRTKPCSVNYIVNKITPSIRELSEISDERLILKILETTMLRVTAKYRNSLEELNVVIVLNNYKVIDACFSQLTEIGKDLGYPDLDEDRKARIVFGVHDLTKSTIEDSDPKKNVWVRIITKKQFKQIKQMKVKKLAVIIKA